MSRRRGPPTFLTLLLFIVGCTALLLFALQARYWYEAVASQRWSTVSGRVVSSRLRGGYFPAGPALAHVEHVAVDYQYVVQGTTYTADAVSLGFARESHERTLKRYPVGTRVLVYYDPQKPGRAVLEPGLWLQGRRRLEVAMFYLVWIAFGVCCILPGIRRWGRLRR